MAFKDLSKAEKLSLLDNLTWDYSVTSEDLLSIIEKNQTKTLPVTKKTLFARCLETFIWEDLISLLGFEKAKKTVHTRSKTYAFSKTSEGGI